MAEKLSEEQLHYLLNLAELDLLDLPDVDDPSDIEYEDGYEDDMTRPISPLNILKDILDGQSRVVSSDLQEIIDEDRFSDPELTVPGPSIAQPGPSTAQPGPTSVQESTVKPQKAPRKKPEPEPNRHWKKKEVTTDYPDFPPTEDVLHTIFASCETGTDVFLQLLSPCLENIVFQSNLYATQRGKTLNLSEEEFLVFIGMNFVMGYHVLPSKAHYWSGQEDLAVPIVANAMPRDRFDEILSNLHVNDNSAIPKDCEDKLYKLRPMITALNQTFSSSYTGTNALSVDESTVLFKGRSSMKQYNPMKPIKRGFKIWAIADQKGYISKFDVYQGKNESLEEEFKDYGLGERVVLQLSKMFWGSNRFVVFDNYFSSVKLMERLKAEGLFACGTVRLGRKGLPQNIAADKDLKNRGDYDYRISSLGISYFKWHDNKVINLISNFHGTEESSVKRTQKDGSKKTIKCPLVVNDYNTYMGGVDMADRYRVLYDVNRKSKKWWHRLFFALVDICFVNAYVISEEMFGECTILDFRRSVARALIAQKNLSPPSKAGSKPSGTQKSRTRLLSTPKIKPTIKRRKLNFSVPKDVRLANRGGHWPVFLKKRGRCEVCSQNKVQSKPSTKCCLCNVYLCLNEKKKIASQATMMLTLRVLIHLMRNLMLKEKQKIIILPQ